MRIDFVKKIRIFLIAVLVLLVAGMTMLGVLNLNRTIDNRPSYEMQISVDQNAGDSVAILKSSSQTAIDNLFGSNLSNYSYQEMNDGALIIYKFNSNVTEYADDVKTAVQTALDANAQVTGVKADVKVYENYGDNVSQGTKVALALGIAGLVIFIYALIMNKLAGGVAVLCSSFLSMLLFLALMAITRIPATYWAVLMGATAALSSAIALVLTTKYKSLKKADDKMSATEVCETVHKSFLKVFIVLAISIALSAIIAGAVGAVASIFLGLTILVAGVASVVSAIYMTPFIWSLIKGNK